MSIERWRWGRRLARQPRVYRTRDDGHTMLLQRVRPGENLRATGAGAVEILTVLGALARRIHVVVRAGTFGALVDAAEAASWRAALSDARDRHELDRLLAPRAHDRLLHLDLHWLNALRAGTGWVAIDPKPLIGDPCAEVFAFLDGPPLTAIPPGRSEARRHVKRLIEIYAAAAVLDLTGSRAGCGCAQSPTRSNQARQAPKAAQLTQLADALS